MINTPKCSYYKTRELQIIVTISLQRQALTPVKYSTVSHTYKLAEAGQQGEQPPGWESQAAVELLELHCAGALPNCADLSPGGTPEIKERPDSHGSLSPALTVWPGHAWSQSSDSRHRNRCVIKCCIPQTTEN